MKTKIILTLIALSILPTTATARNRVLKDAMNNRCRGDVHTLCGTLAKGRDPLVCYIANASKLSGPCQAAIKAASCDMNAPFKQKKTFPCSH